MPSSKVPNAFFGLFTTEAAAQDIVNASPIRYRLIAEAPSADPSDPVFSVTPAEDALKNPEEHPAEETMFELNATPTSWDATKYVRDPYFNSLHGPYEPVSENRSYIAASLANNVPNSLWSDGLKDWETANLRWTYEQAPGGRATSSSALMFHKRQRERTESKTPIVMRGLRQFAEERAQIDAEQGVQIEGKDLEAKTPEPNNHTKGNSQPNYVPMKDQMEVDQDGQVSQPKKELEPNDQSSVKIFPKHNYVPLLHKQD